MLTVVCPPFRCETVYTVGAMRMRWAVPARLWGQGWRSVRRYQARRRVERRRGQIIAHFRDQFAVKAYLLERGSLEDAVTDLGMSQPVVYRMARLPFSWRLRLRDDRQVTVGPGVLRGLFGPCADDMVTACRAYDQGFRRITLPGDS